MTPDNFGDVQGFAQLGTVLHVLCVAWRSASHCRASPTIRQRESLAKTLITESTVSAESQHELLILKILR